MLTRQKVILSILDWAQRPMKKMVLVKLAFLVRQEVHVASWSTFYDFVPYKYGPFSFTMYRELSTLERDGYIRTDQDSVRLECSATARARSEIQKLPEKIRGGVMQVFERYTPMSQRELVKFVYSQYPWYASQSQLTELASDKAQQNREAAAAVYTVGYEGKSVDLFFDQLMSSGIRCLLDVRANPISRKYGFSLRSLGEIAGKLGVEYQHWPTLGVPTWMRRNLTTYAAFQRLLDRYERNILSHEAQNAISLAHMMSQKPCALLCREKDISCCHRGRLAAYISKINGLPVIHL